MAEVKDIVASPQQQTVFDFTTKSTQGNGLITAVAGSGKTWTLLHAVPGMEGYVAFTAYNTNISNEIEGKMSLVTLPNGTRCFVGTVHRFGRKALVAHFPKGRLTDSKKGEKSKIDQMMATIRHPKTGVVGVPKHLETVVRKAYNLGRDWGAGVLPEFPFKSREKWLDLVEHFDLRDDFANSDGDLPLDIDQLISDSINWAVRLIRRGVEMCDKIWDFSDMIYVPLFLNLRIEPFNWVLVDECQDINPTRRALIKKMLAPGGRALFVGDPHQAIYGFTGADSASFENIRKEFGCTDLGLTWSFRCAKSIVRFVQQWVSHIQSHPDAPEGEVIQTDEAGMWGLNPSIDDAILCRNNAPLVDLFFALLKRGIPSHIEGKDISSKLLKMASRWPSLKSLVALGGKLEEYKERQIQKGLQSGREDKAEEVADIVDAIHAVISGLPVGSTVETLKKTITDMFEDTKEGKKPKNLTLTSIHKSKGREWKRVFWYGRNRYNPSSYARQAWQMEQEVNLMYVAGTRAKTTLVDVSVVIPPKRTR